MAQIMIRCDEALKRRIFAAVYLRGETVTAATLKALARYLKLKEGK